MSSLRLVTVHRIHVALLLGMLLMLLAASGIAQASPTGQTTARFVSGTISAQDDGGGFSKAAGPIYVGTGFSSNTVKVLLTGWSFQYNSEDHHIKTVKVKISDVNYSSSSGYVTFTVSGGYYDKNFDDDYVWSVDYMILALG